MKGVLFAISTVLVWAILNVVNRYCVVKYDVNIIVFTSYMIFATGVSLLLIRKRVTPQDWKNGVKYSWLYTLMQIIRSFSMISTFVYITSTETSLLFNIEIVITYIMAYLIFRRKPYKGDYWGIFIILTGFILFIVSLPKEIRTVVSILVIVSATASCIRSIIVEETTVRNPQTTVRQKCGISGYTMFVGGLLLVIFFFITAGVKYLLGENPPQMLSILNYLPDFKEIFHPATIISACTAGFCINALTTYLYYSTLEYSKSETFMAVRAFQPVITYTLEFLAAFYLAAMRPDLNLKDYLFGCLIILGSLLILVVPSRTKVQKTSKDFIAD